MPKATDQCGRGHGPDYWVPRSSGSGHRCQVCSRESNRRYRERGREARRLVAELGILSTVDLVRE